jgi:hypothetical protein
MKSCILPLLILAFVFTGNHCRAQEVVDAVILKNGSKILGTIIEQVPNKSLMIRTRDGSEFVYTFDEIEIIRKDTLESHIRDLRDVSYGELGINAGTPAGLNLAIGYWFSSLGIRASGMIFGSRMGGGQLNLGLKLSDNTNRSHVLALVAGTSYSEREEIWFRRKVTWTYVGAAYELNLGGFFLQGGLTVGEGDFSNPQIIIQIGYMYRFLED